MLLSLVRQQCSGNASVEYTMKLPYKVISLFHFVYLLHKIISRKYMIKRLIHDLFHFIPGTEKVMYLISIYWCQISFPYQMMFMSVKYNTTGVNNGTGTTTFSGQDYSVYCFSGKTASTSFFQSKKKQFSVQCFVDHCLSFFFSFFTILLSLLLRVTTSHYCFNIFKFSEFILYS